MATYSISFSPTGGVDKVMKVFEESFKVENKIDLTLNADFSNYEFHQEDLCFIGAPAYGGRVPVTQIQRIRQMKGNGAKAVLVAVYGNREFEDTLLELKNELKEAGFVSVAAVSAIAEHSIVREFGAGRPDAEDEAELAKFALAIKEELDKNPEKAGVEVPGNFPYREFGGGLKPEVGEACVKCGLCAAKCPVGAIAKDAPNTTDKDVCISCMRCVAICPMKARTLNSEMMAGLTQKLAPLCAERKQNKLFL